MSASGGKRYVAVVDYGMGNLRSVSQAVLHVAQGTGIDVLVTHRPDEVRGAERVVLPGQGAMRDCMAELAASGMKEAVLEAAASKPLMGVCVGMQMLLDGQLQPDGSRYKVPQMGWNRVHPTQPHPMWQGIPDGSWFYFVHSYYACPEQAAHTAAQTDYGLPFTCAIARDNIFATQFHPEKSAEHGLALYRNFLDWRP